MVKIANCLKVESLSYSFSDTRTINNVSFNLHSGDLMVFWGANGAGKSTLLKCICNIIEPTKGYVSFNDIDNNVLRRKHKLTKIYGYLAQNQSRVPDITASEFAITGRAPHIKLWGKPTDRDYGILSSSFKLLGIEHLYYKPYANISGGEQQQVRLARILCQEPKVILLDEPSNYLDIKNQARILDLINFLRSQGYIIMLSTHDPAHIHYLGNCRVAVFQSDETRSLEIVESNMFTWEYIAAVFGIDLQKSLVRFMPQVAALNN